jgi:hypothetical protein
LQGDKELFLFIKGFGGGFFWRFLCGFGKDKKGILWKVTRKDLDLGGGGKACFKDGGIGLVLKYAVFVPTRGEVCESFFEGRDEYGASWEEQGDVTGGEAGFDADALFCWERRETVLKVL